MAANERQEDRIIQTPGVCGGDPRIKGTRLSVWGLDEWRRLRWSDARILDAYPQLTPEDLDAAWAYVAQHRDEIEEAMRANEEP
jgi:type III restriction enzyme